MFGAAFTAPLNGVRAPWGWTICDVLLAVAVVALICQSVTGSDDTEAPPALPVPRPYLAGVALLLAGGIVGTAFAAHPAASLLNLAQFGLAAGVPVLVLWGWRPDVATLVRYAWCWLAGAAVSAVVALGSGGDASGRVAGLSAHPNHLAMISTLGAALAVALAVCEQGRRRWLAAGATALLAVAVIRSGSRAGLLALVVAGAVLVIRGARTAGVGKSLGATWAASSRGFSPRRRLTAPAVVVGSVVAATLVLAERGVVLGGHNAIRRAFGDATTAASDHARASLLWAGLRSIAAHPVTGSGFEHALQAHDIYVQVWVAGGLLGLVGLVVVAATTVRCGLAVTGPSTGRGLATGLVAGYLAYLAAGTVQNFLWDRYLWLHVAVILWLGATARTKTRAQPCG